MNERISELLKNAETIDLFPKMPKWKKRLIDIQGWLVAQWFNFKYSLKEKRK